MNSALPQIIACLKEERGIDFGGYREATLRRRIAVRMTRKGLLSPGDYLQALRTDPTEADSLIDVLGVSVSSFFRDPLVFETIAAVLLPELLERKKEGGSREIRVWSAGCASGEEAYSLAVLLQEALKKEKEPWQSYVFASDISGEALRQAEAGRYPREKFLATRLGILDEYFRPTAEGFEVSPALRAMVQFSMDDLTWTKRTAPAESIYGTFDLVLCRNVLIYFDPELQGRVLEKLHSALASSGCLVLGSAESLRPQVASRFHAVDARSRIYRKAS